MNQDEKILLNPILRFSHPNQDSSDNLFSTNNVLIDRSNPKQPIVYLPGYFRAKAKNFTNIDLTNLTSQINMDLIYNIYYGDIFLSDKNFRQKVKTESGKTSQITYEQQLLQTFQNTFKLNFSRGDSVLLATEVNQDENLEIRVRMQKDNGIRYTVRKVFSLHMDGNIWLSPFELLNSILQVTIQPLTFQLMDKKYTFRVNLMNHPQSEIKLSLSENKLQYAKYELATNLTKSAYTNVMIEKPTEFDMDYHDRIKHLQQKNQQRYGYDAQAHKASRNNDEDVKNFQYAYFNLPIFKHPMDTILTSFVPIWLLGLINLGIFFQDQNLNDRLGSIIGLSVALITYIPTIEETTPPTPKLMMAKLMVYFQIVAVICTYIHSMRVKFLENYKMEWFTTPEYWIAVLILGFSTIIVIIMTIVHYFHWIKIYSNRKYKDGHKHQKKERNYEDQRLQIVDEMSLEYVGGLIKSVESQSQKNISHENKSNGFQFVRRQWSNLECDVYFNRIFVGQREKGVVGKGKSKRESTRKQQSTHEHQFASYFVITRRNLVLTSQQVLDVDVAELSKIETETLLISNQTNGQKKSNKIKIEHPDNGNKTSHPLILFSYKDKGNAKQQKQIKQVNLYLPAYMRLKFKNFTSLDLQNLGGQLNATMIMTVYYGGVFDYMKRSVGLSQQGQEQIIESMKNQFVMLFDHDDALLLAQGKMNSKIIKYKDQEIKPKRNIQLTVKQDRSNKTIQFTIRKSFHIRMQSDVFLTPIQILKTLINVTVNTFKMQINSNKSKIGLVINLNFMDTKSRPDKISVSQVKNFCKYGLILPELNIGYYNNKVLLDKDFKRDDEKSEAVESYWDRREQKRKQKKQYEKIFEDLEKVFTNQQYIRLRASYRKKYQNDNKVREYCQKRQFSLKMNEQEKTYLRANEKMAVRKFEQKQSYSSYKYACIKIPMFKYPFDSIAIIFFPLWLLAILNLGIYFQTQYFANRVISIAALLIAFVALIPTIRSKIPPNPSVKLVELLVASLLFTCFLTLGHSMSVRFQPSFQFIDWNNDAWFLISLIITLATFVIVVVLLVYHYVSREPQYTRKSVKYNKFDRRRWQNDKCQVDMQKYYSFETVYQDSKDSQMVVYKIVNRKDAEKERKEQMVKDQQNAEPKENIFKTWWRSIFGGDQQQDRNQSENRESKRGSQSRLKSINDDKNKI